MAADPTTMHPASGSGNGQEKEQEALKDTFPASDPVAAQSATKAVKKKRPAH